LARCFCAESGCRKWWFQWEKVNFFDDNVVIKIAERFCLQYDGGNAGEIKRWQIVSE